MIEYKRGDIVYYAKGGNQDYDVYTGMVYEYDKKAGRITLIQRNGRVIIRCYSCIKPGVCGDKALVDRLREVLNKRR